MGCCESTPREHIIQENKVPHEDEEENQFRGQTTKIDNAQRGMVIRRLIPAPLPFPRQDIA